MTVGGFANVFAIGDMTSLNGLPGQSPVAMQGGSHAAKTVNGKVKAGTPFKYFDKGSMSIISRFSAVCRVRKVESGHDRLVHVAGRARDVPGGLPQPVRRCDVVVRSYIGHRRPHFHYAQEPMKIEAAPPVTEREPELAHSA